MVRRLAEMQLAADGSRMVVFAAQIDAPVALQPPLLRLTGLDPQARYRLTMLEHPVGHHSSSVALSQGAVTLNGAALMAQGASGMVYGRNVYQHSNPASVVTALMAIIHQGVSGEEALAIYERAG